MVEDTSNSSCHKTEGNGYVGVTALIFGIGTRSNCALMDVKFGGVRDSFDPSLYGDSWNSGNWDAMERTGFLWISVILDS